MNYLSLSTITTILTESSVISQILNYTWLIVAGILLLGALGYALTALWKGIYKTTLKFILLAIGIVCLIFFMPQIVNTVSTFNLSKFGGGFDVTINDVSYHFGILDEVLADILINNELVSASSVGELYKVAIMLSHSIIGFAMYFIGCILLAILVPLISALLYQCLVKFMIPKMIRTKHKLRFVSMIEGMICGLVAMTLFISPLTSLAGQISKQDEAYDTLVENGIIPENYKQYTDVLMSYDDSILFKTMTFGSSNPSKGIDAKIMENVTKVIINGETYNIYEEVDNLLKMVPAIAQNLEFIIDATGKQTVNLTKLLQVSSVDALLSTVSNSNLLTLLLPVFIEMGLNQVDISVEGQRLNFDNIDWSTEVNALRDLYKAFYDAGLIDSALEVAINKGEFKIDLDGKSSLIEYFESTLNNPNNIIVKNLPLLMAYFAKTLNVPYIPTSPSVYENIDFGTEISTILDIVYGLLDTLNDSEERVVTLSKDFMKSIPNKLLDILKNPTVNKNPKDPNSEKIENEKYIKLRNLVTGDKTQKGVLDLQLVQDDVFELDKILKSLLNQVNGVKDYIDDATYEKISEFILDKNEIGLLLDSTASIFELTNGFDIKKEEDRQKVSDILDQLKESAIFKDIIPSLLKKALKQQPSFSDMLFGVELSDLDFECKDKDGNSIIVQELNNILDLAEDAFKIVDVMQDQNNKDAASIFKKLDVGALKKVLVGVYENKILNPSKLVTSKDGDVYFVQNINFNKLIKGILSQEEIKAAGIELPKNFDSIVWYAKEGNDESGEIINLINAVSELKKNTFLLDSSFTVDTLTDNDLNNLTTLLSTISQCELINYSLPSILNRNIGSQISSFFGEDVNVKINFYNVEDWASETDALVNVVRKTKSLANNTFDFSKIDFKAFKSQEDELKLRDLLSTIADCSLFGVHQLDNGYYSDNFGELLYSTIDNLGMDDLLGGGVDHELFTSVLNKNTGDYDSDFWTGPTVEKSEIAKICHMIVDFNIANDQLGSDGFNGGNIPKELLNTNGPIENLLFSCMESRTFSSIINGALESILEKVTVLDGKNRVSLNLINIDNPSKDDVRLLLNLYSRVDEIKDLFGKPTLEMSNDNILRITDLLNDISSCKLFTTVKVGELYSFFNELMASILNITKLDTMLTGVDEHNPHLRDYTLLKLDGIDNWSALDSTKYNKWKDLINSTSRVSSVNTFNYEKLRVAANDSNSELLRIMNIFKVVEATGADYKNLSDITNVEPEVVSSVLKSVNDSHLIHRAVPSIVDKLFGAEGINIEKYAIIKDNALGELIKSYEINTKVHGDWSEENRDFWNHEINEITKLYKAVKEISPTIKPTLDNIKIDSDKIKLYDFVGPMSDLNILKESRHAIIYNFLNNVKGKGINGETINVLDFIRGTTPLAKANLIKSYFFPINASKDYLNIQCQTIDNLINSISKGVIDVKSINGVERVSNMVLNSFILDVKSEEGCVKHYEENYLRGYLAQELVSGLLSDSFVKAFPSNADFFNKLFRNTIIRTYNDFIYLNAVELNGIKGLFKLVEASKYKDANTNSESLAKLKECINDAFKLMGRKQDLTYTYDDTKMNQVLLIMAERQIYAKNPEYSLYTKKDGINPLANSIIAKKLIFEYASDVVVIQETNVPGVGVVPKKTLADLIKSTIQNEPGLDFKDISFEILGNKIVETIDTLITNK